MERWRVEKHFWADVDVRGPDECWPWHGARAPTGYGRVQLRGHRKTQEAHRVAYEFSVGAIPKGCHIHHRCRSRSCCNPAHLEPITPPAHAALHHPRRSHCPKGHPYKGANLIESNGFRYCRTCQNEYDRKRNATPERKAKLAAMARKRKQDPEYAARKREYQRQWAARKRATDPEFADRERKAAREYQRRKRVNRAPA